MLKVGDKLLCKKSSECYKKYEGKCYTISKIDINYNLIQIDDWFSLYYDDIFYYIWYYFYTPQELRKMKLEKLLCK